jgi:hypothetical protein
MDQQINPYAAPLAAEPASIAESDAEVVRREHLSHEASVKSIGFLFYFGGGFLLIAFCAPLLMIDGPRAWTLWAVAWMTIAVGLAMGQICCGYGLRRLRKWARIPSSFLCALGLVNAPIGTLISVYLLYLLLSNKGKTVFSDDYQLVIQQTPHIKYRTSRLMILVLVILIGVLIALGTAAWLSI